MKINGKDYIVSADFANNRDTTVISLMGRRSGKLHYFYTREIIKGRAEAFASKAVEADFEVIEDKPEIKLLNP